MEQEIYIEKIAKGYNISKEAIFGQVNKINYQGKDKNTLKRDIPIINKKNEEKSRKINRRKKGG